MANAKYRGRSRLWLILIVALAAIIAGAWYSDIGQRLRGDAAAGTAYGARVACSCRFVAGRSLESCAGDKLSGMGLIRFSADEEAKSVTASVPLLAEETARLREGYGCVLESWRARGA